MNVAWFAVIGACVACAFNKPFNPKGLELFRIGLWTLYWSFCAFSLYLACCIPTRKQWVPISIASLFGFIGIMGADALNNGTPGEIALYLFGIAEPVAEPASINGMRQYYHLTSLADLALATLGTLAAASAARFFAYKNTQTNVG